jgi:hypothetical protein
MLVELILWVPEHKSFVRDARLGPQSLLLPIHHGAGVKVMRSEILEAVDVAMSGQPSLRGLLLSCAFCLFSKMHD